MDFSRILLKEVVAIHQAMFEKLLFDENGDRWTWNWPNYSRTPAKTYLQIAERISETCLSSIPCKIEHFPEPGVVLARRIVQPELVAEPWIFAAEDLAQPIEDQTDRTGAAAGR